MYYGGIHAPLSLVAEEFATPPRGKFLNEITVGNIRMAGRLPRNIPANPVSSTRPEILTLLKFIVSSRLVFR